MVALSAEHLAAETVVAKAVSKAVWKAARRA